MDDKTYQRYAKAYLDEQQHFEKYIYEMQARLGDSVDETGRLVSYCANALYFLNRYMDLLGEDTARRIMKAVDEAAEGAKKKEKSNVIDLSKVRKPKGLN